MKKIILLTMVAAAILTSCGNGGGNSKNNQYLGAIPAICADYKATKEALKEKGKTLTTPKEFTKWEEDKKANEEKAIEALRIEAAKIENKPLPISYSKALTESGNLFFTAESVVIPSIKEEKINMSNTGLAVKPTIIAKEDLEVLPQQRDDYRMYYRLVTSTGKTLQKSFFVLAKIYTVHFSETISLKTGESLTEGGNNLPIMKDPEAYSDFAGIEFITKEEFDAPQEN